MKSPACFAFSLAVLAAACGGNVLVDGPGSTSTSTSGPTTTGVSLCVVACQAVNSACPGQMSSDCFATCNKIDPLFENACPQEYEAYMTCVAANAPLVCSTGTPMACSAEIMALMPCLQQVCGPDPSNCTM